MKTYKYFLMAILCIMSPLYKSYAKCSLAGDPPSTQTVGIGNVIVARDIAVGTVILNKDLPLNNVKSRGCSSNGYTYTKMTYNGGQSAGYSGYYKTNIPGVAIAISAWDYYGQIEFPFDNPEHSYYWNGSYGMFAGPKLTVKLMKTGDIKSGALASGQAGIKSYDSGETALTVNLSGGQVSVVSCSITTPTLTFPIGDISASAFGKTVGTIPSGAQKTQNLGLNCDAGSNINVSLTGTQNPDVGTTSVLALTGQGNSDVAKGVGVQILYNGSPLVLNNRIVLKQSSGGQETFPLTARYYQTKTAISTGTANASATLNLTYQ